MELIGYKCYKCGKGFARLTDGEIENRVACFYGDCEGWMYPVEIEEPYRPRATFGDFIFSFLLVWVITYGLLMLLKWLLT